MKKIVVGLLVVSVIIPGIAAASVTGDIVQGILSVPAKILNIFSFLKLSQPEKALSLVTVPSATVSSSLEIVSLSIDTPIFEGSKTPLTILLVNHGSSSISKAVFSTSIIQESRGKLKEKSAGSLVIRCGDNQAKEIPIGECQITDELVIRGDAGPATLVFSIKEGKSILAEYRVPVTIDPKPVLRSLVVARRGTVEGVVVSNPTGLECGRGSNCTGRFPISSTVTLNGSSTDPGATVNWLSGCDSVSSSTNTCEVLIDKNKRVVAQFEKKAVVVASGTLTVTKNNSLNNPIYAQNQSNARIGSYVFSASDAEPISVNRIEVGNLLSVSTSTPLFQSLKLMVGNVQFGTTQANVRPQTSSSFSGSLQIPAGQSKVVDVYADILSSQPGLYQVVSAITGCSALGLASFAQISCSYTPGQDITIGGQSNLNVLTDPVSPPAGHLAMGSVNNILAAFRFVATSSTEDIRVTRIAISDMVSSVATVKPSFSNLRLYQGNNLLGSVGAPISEGSSTYLYSFNLSTPLIIPQSGLAILALVGDVASYSSSGATDNSVHIFKITTSTNPLFDNPGEVVTAFGKTSNNSSSIILSSPVANRQTVLRSILYVSSTPLGATTNRIRTNVDDLANIYLTADSAGDVRLDEFIITLGGSALSQSTSSGNFLSLYDPTDGTSVSVSRASTSFAIFSNLNKIIPAGSTKVLRLRFNSLYGTKPEEAGASQSFSAIINSQFDVSYTTGLVGGTFGIGLSNYAAPMMLNTVQYISGT